MGDGGFVPIKGAVMNPTRRIATILTVATVTLAGAGLALASVGGSTTEAEAAAPAASTDVKTDPAALRALTRQLSLLDSRSNKLSKLLEGIRGKSQQVSRSTVIAGTTASGSDDAPAPASAPAPAPATTQSDDSEDSYEGDDDEYENESEDESDEHEDEGDEHESESESDDE
jgi:hypothetical protein